MKTYLYNATLVLEDEVIEKASLLIDDGLILEINPSSAVLPDHHHDCHGHMLIPGLVDLHCDVIERDVEIRRDVHVPMELSIREADRRNASSGITTQFHGISFGHAERGLRDDAKAAELARVIRHEAPSLLVDNRILLRYELGSEHAQTTISQLISENCADMLSFMDHSPGVQHYGDILAQWKSGESPAPRSGLARMQDLVAQGHARKIPMGSHDDDSLTRLAFLASQGVTLSEFPKTMEVAREAIRLGMRTIVGGPNAVRGGSHLKWMAAADALRAGVASAICSDYHPTILPQAIFRLFLQGVADLPAIVRSMTLSPARAVGLDDRGVIAAGKRADLVEIARDDAGWARVASCWSKGNLVANFPGIHRIVSAHSSNPHTKLLHPNTVVIQA